MAKFQALLNIRLKQKNLEKNKMTALAEKTGSGNLSSFSGVFRVSSLTDSEKKSIETILEHFQNEEEEYNSQEDLKKLTLITSEVKAITNQAIILHGERIKKAQQILKNYKEGAFTAWLISTYGNRQTPYNFLQYYEFYISVSSDLQLKIDQMPRQAIYTLASRSGALEQKEEIIQGYAGQAKQELLEIIRNIFPLSEKDKRLPNIPNQTISFLKKLKISIEGPFFQPSQQERKQLTYLLKTLLSQIENV